MRVFRRGYLSGPGEMGKAQLKTHSEKSRSSDYRVDVRIGDNGEVFFRTLDYKVDGFSLSLEELEALAAEAKATKARKGT